MRNSTLHNWRTDAFPLCSVPMRVHLLRLAWRDRPKSMVVMGVSTDDSEAAAKAYLRQSNATLNHFIDQDLAVENMLGANRLPRTVLVNEKGVIVGKHYGHRQWDQPEAIRWIEAGLRKK